MRLDGAAAAGPAVYAALLAVVRESCRRLEESLEKASYDGDPPIIPQAPGLRCGSGTMSGGGSHSKIIGRPARRAGQADPAHLLVS